MGMIPLGSVIKVAIAPFVDHEGVVTGYDWDGTPLVTNASQRTGWTLEERIDVVTGSQPYRVEYPSNHHSSDVVRRAKSLIGRKYDLMTANCRDVVRYAHDLGPWGKILTILGAVGLLVGGVVAIRALAKAK